MRLRSLQNLQLRLRLRELTEAPRAGGETQAASGTPFHRMTTRTIDMKYCARISRIWEVASFAVLIGFDRAFHPAASLVVATYRELSAITEGLASGLLL